VGNSERHKTFEGVGTFNKEGRGASYKGEIRRRRRDQFTRSPPESPGTERIQGSLCLRKGSGKEFTTWWTSQNRGCKESNSNPCP